jgi:hypothetical protein
MKKLTTLILTVSYISLLVTLGLYAMGFFDGGRFSQVDNQEYAAGGFWYSGGFDEGLFSGYGEIRFQNGDSYRGNFRDGRFDGAGVYRRVGDSEEETFRFAGTFEAGRAVSGTFYFSDGETVNFSNENRGVNEQD